jgi:hypothetical protein
MFSDRPDRRDFHLFRRDRRYLRAGMVVVTTLLGLVILALTVPRSGALLSWASALVADLLA